jgi:hypothetical protein
MFPDYLCNMAGFLYTYAVYEVLAITVFMVKATQTALVITDTEEIRANDFKFDRRTILILIILPLFISVPSTFIGGYHTKFGWCIFEAESEAGHWMYIVILAAAWTIMITLLFQLVRIFIIVRRLPQTVYEEIKKQIMSGTGMYAALTVMFCVLYDFLYLFAYIRKRQDKFSDVADYYFYYALYTMQYVLGIAYAAVFVYQSGSLKVRTNIERFFLAPCTII